MGAFALPITAGISGLSSLLGGLLGHGGAKKAAGQLQQAIQQAIQANQDASNFAEKTQQQYLGGETNLLNPFIEAGQPALAGLKAGTSPGGEFTQLGQLTLAQILAQNPGYNFQLQQGQQAIQRGAAAQGTQISGGELKDLTNYSQGLAQQAYQQAFQNFQSQQAQNFNMLSSVAGMGQGAAELQNQNLKDFANNLSNISIGSAQRYGNLNEQYGAAGAAGTLGSTQALESMFGGLANAGSEYEMLRGLQGGGGQIPQLTPATASTLGMALPNNGLGALIPQASSRSTLSPITPPTF